MVIADLKQTCSACQGSGFKLGFNQYGSLHPHAGKKCLSCGGRGYLLTELGLDVWNLLKPLIQELLQEELHTSRPHA